MTVFDIRVISVDSHVDEEIDVLIRELPAALQQEARHRTVLEDGREMIVVPGLSPITLDFAERAAVSSDGHEPDPRKEFRNDPSGGRDIQTRIAAIAADGVWGEVIYPNRTLAMAAHPNPEYQKHMARIYNDWAWSQFSPARGRFVPVAVLPMHNPTDAAAEVHHAASTGFSGVLMPPVVPWRPYWHSSWEPLWTAIEETGLIANFHVFSGNTAQQGDLGDFFVLSDELIAEGRRSLSSEHADERMSTTVLTMAGAMSTLAHLTGAGVLMRHPNMTFVLVESEAGWLPWLLQAMDHMQARRNFDAQIKLDLKPSEYFHRQGYATFIEDRVAIDLLPYIGEDRLMWSNDYPHDEGTFGESEQILQQLMAHLPEATQRKLLFENAARVYGFTPEVNPR
jgi:predicted TIM-barrel fold metal-dependent hydrolase